MNFLNTAYTHCTQVVYPFSMGMDFFHFQWKTVPQPIPSPQPEDLQNLKNTTIRRIFFIFQQAYLSNILNQRPIKLLNYFIIATSTIPNFTFFIYQQIGGVENEKKVRISIYLDNIQITLRTISTVFSYIMGNNQQRLWMSLGFCVAWVEKSQNISRISNLVESIFSGLEKYQMFLLLTEVAYKIEASCMGPRSSVDRAVAS